MSKTEYTFLFGLSFGMLIAALMHRRGQAPALRLTRRAGGPTEYQVEWLEVG